MFEKLFLQILNMSFTASFVILAVIVARLLLKKAPRVISYALWAVVLFRLICPFSFESAISLLPIHTNPIPQEITYQQTPQINTGIPIVNDSVNAVLPAATPDASINPLQGWLAIGTFLWLCGIAVLAIYSTASLLLLKRKLRSAIWENENVYFAEGLASPFVMGLFRPKIYLPASLTDNEKRYILLHEQTHIKRLDHVVKILGFAVLCLHWFNPLVWIAFFLCGKDMEMSCDEAVIKRLGSEIKKEYSSSLLALATGRRIVGGSPLAFGEGDTKSRIKNVLNYKKPAFWVIAVAIIAVMAVGIGLAVNPKAALPAVNTIYSTKLTEVQKAEITSRYQLDVGSNIFETKFHVSDNIKSYAYYVELYQHGAYLGTYVQNHGNFNTRDGSIVTAFSMNRGVDERWESMRWMTSFVDGGYASSPNIPFPNGFVPQGVSTSTLINEGNPEEMPQIAPEQPIIIASIAMNSAEMSELRAYDCAYLMENPEAIAQYECVYIVKCVFSEKDETELAQTLDSSTVSPPSTYLTTFELYNGKGEILQSSFSLATQTATKLPALLLKGTDKTMPSVNDAPQDTEEYLKITIGEQSDRVYFVYESVGKYWVEHPYDYKRELDENTYAALMKYLQADSGTTLGAPIVNSYYATQNSRASSIFQSEMLEGMLEQWTDDAIVNPKWNIDSFTQYHSLDRNMNSTSEEELYYSTFTADNGKQYYMVLRYDAEDGGGLGKVRYSETPYPYDLQKNIADITAKLSQTDLDLATAVAARVQVVDVSQNSAREAIRVTDAYGNQYLYYFDEPAAVQ